MRISATVEVDTMKKSGERNKFGVLRFKSVEQLRIGLCKWWGSLHLSFQRASTCNGVCFGPRLARSSPIPMELLPELPFELLPCSPLKANPREGLKGSGWCLKHSHNTLAEASTGNQSIYALFSIKSVQPAGAQTG